MDDINFSDTKIYQFFYGIIIITIKFNINYAICWVSNKVLNVIL